MLPAAALFHPGSLLADENGGFEVILKSFTPTRFLLV
jgi:hypothetical protein